MCGFSGFLNFNPNWGDPLTLLQQMGDQLTHRGPDDSGVWFDNDFGVGFSHCSGPLICSGLTNLDTKIAL